MQEFWTNQKLYSTIFQISQVVADPFIALAFIFSPFGIKHQNGINLGPFNPFASPKSPIKSKWQ
jgi:tetrahydromethanopterin S-methyltransferase subunit C